jgi:hypothetical protein
MRLLRPLLLALVLGACSFPKGTIPPSEGWSNTAPTVVQRVVDRGDIQILEVQAGTERAWYAVPDIGVEVGEYVLLGHGTATQDVEIRELDLRAPTLTELRHIRVVDRETAERTLASATPADAVPVGTVFAELSARADREIVVVGTVAREASAMGSIWVHIQDGTGDPAAETHDLTVQTQQPVTRGQRVAFRGTLRKDVDLGFGYRYAAMVEDGVLLP